VRVEQALANLEEHKCIYSLPCRQRQSYINQVA
jgi:hypothetical protein